MTTTPNGDSLLRAAHHLGATFLGYRIDEEGSATRIARSKEAASTAVAAAAASGHPATMTAIYAYRRNRAWYLLSDAGLTEYARSARANEYDDLVTYDDAVDLRIKIRMPSWWSPEQRYAWRMLCCYDCGLPRPSTDAPGPHCSRLDHERDEWGIVDEQPGAQRVTADLITGEEVAV